MTGTLTGRAVLLWVAGFFAIVMGMNVYFVIVSVKTFSGEDEQAPYLQGIAYNTILAHRAEQKHLGWRASIDARREKTGLLRIAVRLQGADGKPLKAVALHGELRHPADENRDRKFRLVPAGPGLYAAEVSGVAAGRWDMMVTDAAGKTPFEASRRLWLP